MLIGKDNQKISDIKFDLTKIVTEQVAEAIALEVDRESSAYFNMPFCLVETNDLSIKYFTNSYINHPHYTINIKNYEIKIPVSFYNPNFYFNSEYIEVINCDNNKSISIKLYSKITDFISEISFTKLDCPDEYDQIFGAILFFSPNKEWHKDICFLMYKNYIKCNVKYNLKHIENILKRINIISCFE